MNLAQDKVVSQIVSRLASLDRGVVSVEGTWGSYARLLAAHVSNTLHRPVLYVCPHIDEADKAFDDLKTFGAGKVELLPAWEGEEELADATDETRSERLRIVSMLSDGQIPPGLVMAAPAQALCQPVAKPAMMRACQLNLQADATMDPEAIIEWLVNNSFERVDAIDLPGQFARRGGIIDIYAPLVSGVVKKAVGAGPRACPKTPIGATEPGQPQRVAPTSSRSEAIRLEFFGDTIESIRQIDLDTQRSMAEIESLSIMAATCGAGPDQRELFTNVLPPEAIILFEEPAVVEEVAHTYLARAENVQRLYSWSDIHEATARFAQLHVSRFGAGPGAETQELASLQVKSVQQFERKATSLWAGHKEALEELIERTKEGYHVTLYCDSPAEIQRVSEIIKEIAGQVPHNFELLSGYVHQGFAIDALKEIVVSHHELFGQFTLRRRERPMRATAPVDTLADLQEGDYVVHTSYGIGKFLGTETIEEKGGRAEYLTIEYADRVKIQVSVQNIGLVQKYIGSSPKRPTLSKVGSKRWQKQKEKVAQSVRDLAAELLEVQAKRQALGGIAYDADTNWQMEFEESFPYQETPDQERAIREIKADMQEQVAMDRLLCGDVGYGKTELAMRAAFKVVESGRQVAVLVPTTVLSVQHARTFAERFADFPLTVEVLNRFKTARQARDIVVRAKAGAVDIVIGTHRLLSKDVAFKDLGLLIIDEEQRFGVEHKERLKQMRVNVDILTMTATPIPRTLHMALLGLRDISSLTTPPLDRRSIVTSVVTYSDEMIRKAIYRELNRQGQVFFLHNRVQSIQRKAYEIQQLAKDARVDIAHGQMAKRELEDAMVNFVLGRTDVLVCTTIIESGLDIPNANTIFINDADRFGLAEMHQLRGRVGRYKHRAYAYMLLPNSRPISPIAAKRLKAIEEYSHLGAGFRIALRDLEIRGAGNILGPEQSGHIQMVGYQMYCDLLANAVHELKHEKTEPLPTTTIDIGIPAFIPKNYIPIDRQRMDAYRKISTARTPEDLVRIQGDLTDVYGPPPEDVKRLIEIGGLRIAAGRLGIRTIVAQPPSDPFATPGTATGGLAFTFKEDPGKKARSLFAGVRAEIRVPDPKTIALRLRPSYFEPKTMVSFLRKLLAENPK